jgi:hypothetical protein
VTVTAVFGGPGARVEAVRRLVEDQQLRGRQHGRRDAEPLLHAKRVRAVLVPRAGEQARALQYRVDRGERDPAKPGERLEVVAPAQLRVEGGRLDQRADLGQVAGGLGEVAAEDDPVPALGRTRPSSMRMVVILPTP